MPLLPAYTRPPIGGRFGASISDLIMRQGDIAARRAEQSGAIWGNALNQLGQIGAQTVSNLQAEKAAKAQQAEQEQQGMAIQDLLSDQDAWSDPRMALTRAVQILGPQAGMDFVKGVQGFQQIQQARSPKDAISALPVVARGFLAAGPTGRQITYGGLRTALIDSQIVMPDQLPEQWDEALLPEVESLAKGFAPSEQPEGFTLSPGQVRYGPEGEEIARGPERPQEPPSSIDAAIAAADAAGNQAEVDRLLRLKGRSAAAGRPPAAPAATGGGLLGGVQDEGLKTALRRATLKMTSPQRKAAFELANEMAAAGDMDGLRDVIMQAAIEGENVDRANQIHGRRELRDTLNDAESVLREMEAAGVPTGWLTGTQEDIARRFGKTTNPEYVRLGNRLMDALIRYRRAATGVAFGERESAQYERLMPNYKQDLNVNLAAIRGLLDAISTNDRTYWIGKLGKDGAVLVGAIKPEEEPSGDGWSEVKIGGQTVRIRKKQ